MLRIGMVVRAGGALLAFTACHAAWAAQPPRPAGASVAEAAKPAVTQVCFTNICVDGQRTPAVVDALAKGDAQAVLAAGGTFQDAVAAIAKATAGAEGRPRLPTFLALFQDTADGSTIRQGDVQGRPGLIRTSPDGGVMQLSLDGAVAIVIGGAAMAALDTIPGEGQTYTPPSPNGMPSPVAALRGQLTASGDSEGLAILDNAKGFLLTTTPDGQPLSVTVTAPDGRSRTADLSPHAP